MRFKGSASYVSTEDLTLAVNAAITLQRPLLVKGEPGTGKTMLAVEVAKALGVPLLEWHIKSTTKAQQGLYEYDAVSRLRDSQLGDERVHDIHNYIVKGMLWNAFTQDQPSVLLIDEVDKADIEFPNDLLREQPELRKKPSTSELIDWIAALGRAGLSADKIEEHIPFIGSLLKTEQDAEALKRYQKQGGSYPSNWSELGPRYNQ